MVLPKQRDTDKQEIPLLPSAGRMCLVYRHAADGSMTGANREVAPLPGKGVAIDANADAEIVGRLKQLDNDVYYVAVFVWPDSFEQFKRVRENLVTNGFEYRLVPVPAGEKNSWAFRPRRPSKSSDPAAG